MGKQQAFWMFERGVKLIERFVKAGAVFVKSNGGIK